MTANSVARSWRLLAAVALISSVSMVAPPGRAEAVPAWDLRAIAVQGRYRAVVGDFAGNGRSDILWYAPGAAADAIWFGRSGGHDLGTPFLARPITVGGTYIPIVGNFAGDARDDIVWYRPGAGADYLWTNRGAAQFDSTPLDLPGTFVPVVLHDTFPGNTDDVFAYSTTTHTSELWHFHEGGDGVLVKTSVTTPPNGRPIAGHFWNSYNEDVFIHVPGAGLDTVLYLDHPHEDTIVRTFQVKGSYRPVIVRTRFLDNILWWSDGSGHEAYWRAGRNHDFIDTPVQSSSAIGHLATIGYGGAVVGNERGPEALFFATESAGAFFPLVQPDQGITSQQPLVGDFDQDGKEDILWYGAGSQRDALWYAAS